MKSKLLHYDPADFEVVKKIALTFPETEESTSHEGTPSVKVRGKLMCRLHDNGEFIPIHLGFEFHDKYLNSHPELFHVPDHFKGYAYICMWIQPHYDKKLLMEVLELSWRGLASKKAIKAFDEGRGGKG
ncbi:MAG: hypothetical protein J7621_01925 [Niastella sp.]|nr:hypothetical protein [Niastella sp.]